MNQNITSKLNQTQNPQGNQRQADSPGTAQLRVRPAILLVEGNEVLDNERICAAQFTKSTVVSHQEHIPEIYEHYGENIQALLDLNQALDREIEKNSNGQDKNSQGEEKKEDLNKEEENKDKHASSQNNIVEIEISPRSGGAGQEERPGSQGKSQEPYIQPDLPLAIDQIHSCSPNSARSRGGTGRYEQINQLRKSALQKSAVMNKPKQYPHIIQKKKTTETQKPTSLRNSQQKQIKSMQAVRRNRDSQKVNFLQMPPPPSRDKAAVTSARRQPSDRIPDRRKQNAKFFWQQSERTGLAKLAQVPAASQMNQDIEHVTQGSDKLGKNLFQNDKIQRRQKIIIHTGSIPQLDQGIEDTRQDSCSQRSHNQKYPPSAMTPVPRADRAAPSRSGTPEHRTRHSPDVIQEMLLSFVQPSAALTRGYRNQSARKLSEDDLLLPSGQMNPQSMSKREFAPIHQHDLKLALNVNSPYTNKGFLRRKDQHSPTTLSRGLSHNQLRSRRRQLHEAGASCSFLPSTELVVAGKASQLQGMNKEDKFKPGAFSQKKINITINQKELYQTMRPENGAKRDDMDMLNTARMPTERNHTGREAVQELGGDGEGSLYPPKSSAVSLWGADQTQAIKQLILPLDPSSSKPGLRVDLYKGLMKSNYMQQLNRASNRDKSYNLQGGAYLLHLGSHPASLSPSKRERVLGGEHQIIGPAGLSQRFSYQSEMSARAIKQLKSLNAQQRSKFGAFESTQYSVPKIIQSRAPNSYAVELAREAGLQSSAPRPRGQLHPNRIGGRRNILEAPNLSSKKLSTHNIMQPYTSMARGPSGIPVQSLQEIQINPNQYESVGPLSNRNTQLANNASDNPTQYRFRLTNRTKQLDKNQAYLSKRIQRYGNAQHKLGTASPILE